MSDYEILIILFLQLVRHRLVDIVCGNSDVDPNALICIIIIGFGMFCLRVIFIIILIYLDIDTLSDAFFLLLIGP